MTPKYLFFLSAQNERLFFQFSYRTEDSIICVPLVVRHSNIYLSAAAGDTKIICCSGRETELKKLNMQVHYFRFTIIMQHVKQCILPSNAKPATWKYTITIIPRWLDIR